MYPGIAISFFELAQDRIESLLIEDQLDLGVAFAPVQTADIIGVPIFFETLSFVVGKHHRHARRRAPLTPRDFAAEPLVLLNDTFATRHHVNTFCARQGVVPTVAVEVDSIAALMEIVRRGILGSVLPHQITAAHDTLLSVALEPSLPQRQVSILQRKDSYRSAVSVAFIEMLKVAFGDSAVLGLRQIDDPN